MAAPSASSDDLGSTVTGEGSRRSKIVDGASVSARTWQLLGLPGDQVELVALRVGERGLADRRYARWQRRRRERDLVERPGAQADRAAEGLAPEVRQGGGIGGVDGQGRETQADGGGHGSSSCKRKIDVS